MATQTLIYSIQRLNDSMTQAGPGTPSASIVMVIVVCTPPEISAFVLRELKHRAEEFFREKRDETRELEGNGLGLATFGLVASILGLIPLAMNQFAIDKAGFTRQMLSPLNPPKLPPLYVAYDPSRAEVSDVPHRNLRELFNRGDETVVQAMQTYRDLTDRGRDALMSGDWPALGQIMNENFDLRRSIMPIAPENLRMVEVARSTGASAKFCGSGGAICGLYQDGRQYQRLVDALAEIRCSVLRPIVFEA